MIHVSFAGAIAKTGIGTGRTFGDLSSAVSTKRTKRTLVGTRFPSIVAITTSWTIRAFIVGSILADGTS